MDADARLRRTYHRRATARSTDTPLKQADFSSQWSDFNGMASYKDWQFVAEKAFLDGTSRRQRKPQSRRHLEALQP